MESNTTVERAVEPSAAGIRGPGASIERYLMVLHDPRVSGRTKRRLMDVLTIAEGDARRSGRMGRDGAVRPDVGATATRVARIEDGADAERGHVPSRGSGRSSPRRSVRACAWMLELAGGVAGKQLAIDGESMRRSFVRARKLGRCISCTCGRSRVARSSDSWRPTASRTRVRPSARAWRASMSGPLWLRWMR